MSRAFIAFYMGDYDRDTQHLSTLEHGAYFLLLKHCWVHGSIPLSQVDRGRIAHVSHSQWYRMRTKINAFFDDQGRQKRASIEIEKAERLSTRQAMSGHRGANKRWGKDSHGIATANGHGHAPSDGHGMAIKKEDITTTTSVAAREGSPREPVFETAYFDLQGTRKKNPAKKMGEPMNEKPQKVSVLPPDEPPPPSVTPLDMLNRAVMGGADIAMIEKLMLLHERWDANQARKAFDEAVAAAKRDIPPITRNVAGHNARKYADFAAIAKVVDPIIGAHGLSYRFRTQQNDRISVTCILSHKAGHSEETTLSGPADTSGAKNAIQAIGSTLTYLQRYSLVQMLGLAAGNDDDGKAAGDGDVITDEQLTQLVELADEVGADKIAFCKYFGIESLADIQAKDFPRAVAALNKKKRT